MGNKMIAIAEIVFAMVFIIIMTLLFSKVVNFGDSAERELANMREIASDAQLAVYDGTTVSGDTVIASINKFRETKDGLKISYMVDGEAYGAGCITTGSGSTLKDKNGNALSEKGTSASSTYREYDTNLGGNNFINPVDEYGAELAFTQNGAFIGIIFTKK